MPGCGHGGAGSAPRDVCPVAHVCQLTSDLADAPDFRVAIEPNPENGLRRKSQAMADKPVIVRRERIGRLGNQDMVRLGISFFCLGLCLGARGLAILLAQSDSSTVFGGLMRHFPTPSNNIVQNRKVARHGR